MASKLNAKQSIFVDEYLVDLNATQAAKRAGYSDDTAHRIGAENLQKPAIAAKIAERLKERESTLIATCDEVLQTLTRTLRRKATESVVVTLKTRKSEFDGDGRKVSSEVEVAEVVEIPAKLSDVNRAAELLGKYYKLYTDKTELSGAIPVVIVDDVPAED